MTETVTDFIFMDSKITADCDCSHEIIRCLLLRRKAMKKVDSLLKSRHHFADKGPYSQTYAFSSSHVQMWELDHKEDWEPKIWHFRTGVLQKMLESPLDCKIKAVDPKVNQPWIFIGTESEGMMLKLKLQNFGHLCEEPTHWKRPWYWERLRAGEGGNRGWDGWMALSTQRTWIWANSGRWWGTGKPGMLQSMGSQRAAHYWASE